MRQYTETYQLAAPTLNVATLNDMKREAVISLDKLYRYSLFRQWQFVPTPRIIMWVMLNPSTADALTDDPTIRRCIGYSRQWGYDGMYVGNVYAYRATDPGALKIFIRQHSEEAAKGPENYKHLVNMGHQSARVVYAWGKNAGQGIEHTLGLYMPEEGFWCLGKNKDGTPKHPLYIKSTQPMLPF